MSTLGWACRKEKTLFRLIRSIYWGSIWIAAILLLLLSIFFSTSRNITCVMMICSICHFCTHTVSVSVFLLKRNFTLQIDALNLVSVLQIVSPTTVRAPFDQSLFVDKGSVSTTVIKREVLWGTWIFICAQYARLWLCGIWFIDSHVSAFEPYS